jgi:indolepyruvate ferredoxin oxidoreductase beta subunit
MHKIIDFQALQPVNFLLAGVGGQGTILASDILAEIGQLLGYDVKKAEIHGMSQRGGSVVSNLRWARQVFSPIVAQGEADVLIAFEKLEAARYAGHLRKGGVALINSYSIMPITVSAGKDLYPDDQEIRRVVGAYAGDQYWIDGVSIADSMGNPRTANVVLIGALAGLIGIPDDVLLSALAIRVQEKYLKVNRLALFAGKKAIL